MPDFQYVIFNENFALTSRRQKLVDEMYQNRTLLCPFLTQLERKRISKSAR